LFDQTGEVSRKYVSDDGGITLKEGKKI